MGVQWTKEQKRVIELRDRNILVSAAAGSGKTAVLVERIIRMLTDSAHPLDVDRLLIVTFTEAAAAEMKERIRAAIEKALEERPQDVHLQRQATLIHSARITTIHSFCLSVIREHFHVIDLDPGFRITEEGERKLLQQDVLGEVLEECYISGDKEFLELSEKLGGGRDDRKLEALVLQLYEYSRSYPQPEKWLAGCAGRYQAGAASEQVWRLAERIAVQSLCDIQELLEKALRICEEPDGPYLYAPMLETDLEMIRAAAALGNTGSRADDKRDGCDLLKDIYLAVANLKWQTLSRKKDDTISADKRDEVKYIREQAKKALKDLLALCFFEEPEEMQKDMQGAYRTMRALTGLVQRFADAFAETKRDRNMIDFGDMEQFALRILTQEQEGKLVPSAVAREYQEQFAEVMIDEYQDSNLIQEAILTSVSGVSRGHYNIFMVGDVKQSIYRFRLSRPELFMEKYDTYPLQEEAECGQADERVSGEMKEGCAELQTQKCQRIDLHRNFRSRHEVLDSVNTVFERIMRKELGGITYDEQAALYPGAVFEPLLLADGSSANETELLLLDTDAADDSKSTETAANDMTTGASARELEARMVAGRIRQLVREGQVWDKDKKEFRRARYKDIVILTRSVKGWSDTFLQELTKEGIPVYAGSQEGYFETYEVSVLLDYLKLLDNQRQDVPLAAVLASPFAGLDAQQLAEIRVAYPERAFYEAAECFAADENSVCGAETPKIKDRNLQSIIRKFYRQLTHFREMVPYTPIHELLWKIIEETGYGLYMEAMPGGLQRTANVEMLVEKAAAFEKTSYKGLFHFIRYIELLKKYDVDYGEANIADEQSDTVRIMSIHKSKGLEFPIVFVCGMGKKFNMQDITGSLVIHPEWGVGIDAVDLEERTKIPTLLKKVIQYEVKRENLGEELRVLYVAMTRAKEKLILTGTMKGAVQKLEESDAWNTRCTDTVLREEGASMVARNCAKDDGSTAFPLWQLSGASQYLDWILPAAVCQQTPIRVSAVTPEALFLAGQAEAQAEKWGRETLDNWDAGRIYDDTLHKRLEEEMGYIYPFENEGRRKLKFTVSELKKRAYLEEESGELLMEEPEVVPLLPKFLTEEEELTGASRGSAYHKFLELLDFSQNYGRDELEGIVRVFQKEGRLSQEMADCIRVTDMLEFLQCGSGRRMQRAAQTGQLYKEQPFVLAVDAAEVYPGAESKDTVLVQGIIDVFFEEDGELVVLDYKTDKVKKASELVEKYHAQLDYYARALERLLQKPVKEKWIYSFTLKEQIEV